MPDDQPLGIINVRQGVQKCPFTNIFVKTATINLKQCAASARRTHRSTATAAGVPTHTAQFPNASARVTEATPFQQQLPAADVQAAPAETVPIAILNKQHFTHPAVGPGLTA